ncbi:uncharacterized protein LOC109822547 isoform X1 [Asparagus officinalis]|uniref:uncharacterized protein LOC109822547 isoform X1 n=1 Tax=Asparagus officinalis TaxID=4686 RepID=UPI00098E7CFF|nr:uncharacterized protein LOC109822547 isoform X1 [Asparagus officinalis]
MKWKSRRELIYWLGSIVSDNIPCTSLLMDDRFADDAEPSTIPKGLSSGTMGHLSKEFSWLGHSWDCKKKRKHYRFFCRSGVTISVNDFIYIMGEEYKRLVAYVEDLYEDAKSNKMVLVRWFHKIDEVGIVLPSDTNDKEIFFSLCLQDFSIECIDGLATVLGVQDFDRYQKEDRKRFGSWQPYLCRRQIDNGEVKPFDVTQVQGYWKQELLRSLYATPDTALKLRLKITRGGNGSHRSTSISGSGREKHVRTSSEPSLTRRELLKLRLVQQQRHLDPGCYVEVLSQDSGIRGCWFRCVVLKRRHDRVKVRYEDVQDADDTRKLEEWVLASRIASPDKLGIRLHGRPVVRPYTSNSSKDSSNLDVGSIVDAWWHDGWWEGIVIREEAEGKLRVYFLGERRDSTFGIGDLRPSQDWVDNKWNQLKDHHNVAKSLLADMSFDQSPETGKRASVPNLSEVCNLESLKWSSSRKRRRSRELHKESSNGKRECNSGSSSSIQEDIEAVSDAYSELLLPKTLPVIDNSNCKIGRTDPMLVTSMSLCSSLVLSQ